MTWIGQFREDSRLLSGEVATLRYLVRGDLSFELLCSWTHRSSLPDQDLQPWTKQAAYGFGIASFLVVSAFVAGRPFGVFDLVLPLPDVASHFATDEQHRWTLQRGDPVFHYHPSPSMAVYYGGLRHPQS